MTSGNVSLETDVRGLLEAVDSKDCASLGRYFADGIVFRFGNSDPVGGKAAVLETCVEFLAGIAGISHDIQHLWQVAPDWVVAVMTVHYTRHDGGTLSLPWRSSSKTPPLASMTRREPRLSVSQVTRTWSMPMARACGSTARSIAEAWPRRRAVGRTS